MEYINIEYIIYKGYINLHWVVVIPYTWVYPYVYTHAHTRIPAWHVYTQIGLGYTRMNLHCVCTKCACIHKQACTCRKSLCIHKKHNTRKERGVFQQVPARGRASKHHKRSAQDSQRAQGIHNIPRAQAPAVSNATTAHTEILCSTHVIQSLRIKILKLVRGGGNVAS